MHEIACLWQRTISHFSGGVHPVIPPGWLAACYLTIRPVARKGKGYDWAKGLIVLLSPN